MEVVVTGRHCELSDRFRSHVDGEARPAREARPPHHAGPGRGRVRAQPAPGRPRRAARADGVLQGAGDPGRGRGRGQDGRPRPGPRQDGRPDAPRRRPPARPPRPAHARLASARPSPTRRRETVPPDDDGEVTERQVGPITVTGDGPLVVREKTHPASPMTLDQALYEMELVGHDFYLFVDKESERPCGGLPPPRLRLRRDLARLAPRADRARTGAGGPHGPRPAARAPVATGQHGPVVS